MTPDSEATREDGPVVRAVEPFEAFYHRTYRQLTGLAFVLSGRQHVAEDIAQEALIAAFNAWDRVSRLDDPAAWVRRIVANRSVSLHRKSISELKAMARVRGASDSGPAETDLAEAVEFWRNVRRVLSRQQAVALALRYTEGLTLNEIAQVMNCSPSTANTHLRRAHERLARELRSEWKEDW